MKVLAIGAHPDDIEIFMYGILAMYKKKGDELFLVVATDGAAGNVLITENLIELRRKETKLGLELLGEPFFLNFTDGKLNVEKKAYIEIKKIIDKVNPDLIITHSPYDYHPDHRGLSKYVSESAGFVCPVIFCDTLMGVNFNPNFYVDISSVFDEKSRAILAHKSQAPEKFLQAASLMNRFRSAQCNAPVTNYAEAYNYESKFPFSDIRTLIPDPPKIRSYYIDDKESFI